jgi:transcriptional regulator with XRE-family HTH domain
MSKTQPKALVGRLLRQMRERLGVTQSELSTRIGKPQSFVSKYETGERYLDLLEIRDICRALDTTLEAFVQALERELRALP